MLPRKKYKKKMLSDLNSGFNVKPIIKPEEVRPPPNDLEKAKPKPKEKKEVKNKLFS